jgi:hypothetical protein
MCCKTWVLYLLIAATLVYFPLSKNMCISTGDLVGTVHPAAVPCGLRRAQASRVRAQRLHHGQGAHGGNRVRERRPRCQDSQCRRSRSRDRPLRAVADGPWNVELGDGCGWEQGPLRVQWHARVAPHPVEWCCQRPCPPASPCSSGIYTLPCSCLRLSLVPAEARTF